MPTAPFLIPRRLVQAFLVLAALALLTWGGLQLWAWHQFRAGRAALEVDDLDGARAHLDACLRVWGGSAEAHLLAARAARRSDDLDAADRHLSEHERLGGDTQARTLEWAMLRAQRGGIADVRDYLVGVSDAADGAEAALALEALTKGYVRAGLVGEARGCLDDLLRRRPGDFAAHLLRGDLLRELGEKPEALADFETAVAARPASLEARLRRANVLAAVGRLADAVADYEALRRARPDQPEVLFCLARLRHDCHQLDEADALLGRLLAAQPHHPGALAWRARVALRRGETERAEGWARQAADLAPEDGEMATLLALTLEAQGKLPEARDYRDRAARIDNRLEQMKLAAGRAPPAPPGRPSP